MLPRISTATKNSPYLNLFSMASKSCHIVHILPTLNIGGAERAVVQLINESDPQRFRYSIIILFDEQPLASEILPGRATVTVVEKTSLLGFGLRTKLVQALRRLKPDIVHTHLFSPDVWGRLAAKDMRLPVVTTEHNSNTHDGWIKNGLRRLLRNYTDEYVACSQHVKEYVQTVYGIKRPITVIPWGITLKHFIHLPPPRFEQPVRLLILGRLFEQKGHDLALAALARLKDFAWSLNIVGSGPREQTLKELTATLGLKERVQFMPATLQVAETLAQCDVLLVPSRWEGLGIVAMEGLAAGRLVVASAVGGLTELIKDQETGLLSTPTVVGFYEVLQRVFENPAAYRAIAERGGVWAQAHVDIRTEVAQYEAVYSSLCR